MQTDWNFVLNVLLFVGVLWAIAKIIKSKINYSKRKENSCKIQDEHSQDDDNIIAIRKIEEETENLALTKDNVKISATNFNDTAENVLMIFLLAKDNNKFIGFDLLHALLSVGLRYGQGQIFHHYQDNGKNSILYSLAAATHNGTFDLQTINDYKVNGLCLFFEPCGNGQVDSERFKIMYNTAIELSKILNAQILDEFRRPLSDNGLEDYYNKILVG